MLRPILDLGIFFSRHTFLTFALGLALWRVLSTPRLSRVRARLGLTTYTRGWMRSGAIVLLGLFLAIGVWYQQLDGFAGEVEPLVSSVSWLLQEGAPLYHGLDSPDRYSVLYGPSVFLTNGLFLELLGPSLYSAKVASFLAGLGSLFLICGALARPGKSTVAVGVSGLAVLLYWSQGFAVYLVRPDALLLFAVAMAMFCAARVRVGLAVVAMGVLLGFGANLKIHAFLYFMPAFGILAGRARWPALLQALVLGGVVTLAPFLLYPQISLTNYLDWLRNAMAHGVDLGSDLGCVQYGSLLVLPLVVALIWHPHRRNWILRHRGVLWLTALAMVGTYFFAAKPGAGVVHYLPFVPVTLYLAGLVASEVSLDSIRDRPRVYTGLIPAMMLAVLVTGGVHVYRSVKLVNWQVNQAPGLAADVQQIMDTYPDMKIAMACGGENSKFRATWVRPLLVYRDNPLFIDPIAVMDNCLAGRPMPEMTYTEMGSGRVAVWLVPRDAEPFAKENWYPPHDQIFDQRFQAEFHSHYTPRTRSRYFDLWFWNGLPEEMSDELIYAAREPGP